MLKSSKNLPVFTNISYNFQFHKFTKGQNSVTPRKAYSPLIWLHIVGDLPQSIVGRSHGIRNEQINILKSQKQCPSIRLNSYEWFFTKIIKKNNLFLFHNLVSENLNKCSRSAVNLCHLLFYRCVCKLRC